LVRAILVFTADDVDDDVDDAAMVDNDEDESFPRFCVLRVGTSAAQTRYHNTVLYILFFVLST
jgi:hypothetical protein